MTENSILQMLYMQRDFMEAGDQTVEELNPVQEDMYSTLVQEEVQELEDAPNVVEELDALIDIMVVSFGLILSRDPQETSWELVDSDATYEEVLDLIINGDHDPVILIKRCILAIKRLDIEVFSAWCEVMDTNMAKIDPNTGKVRKREDGKILKPEGWKPPNLARFFYL